MNETQILIKKILKLMDKYEISIEDQVKEKEGGGKSEGPKI